MNDREKAVTQLILVTIMSLATGSGITAFMLVAGVQLGFVVSVFLYTWSVGIGFGGAAMMVRDLETESRAS